MKKILFLILFLIPNIAHADITTGLIAWINPTNNTSPTPDSSGNSNNWNFFSGPSFVSGPNGLGAIQLLATSGQVAEINYNSTFNSGVGTWSFWIKTTQNTSSSNYSLMNMVNSGGSLNGLNIFMSGANGQIVSNAKNNSSMSVACGTAVGLNDGNWHLITTTWSQSNGGTISCYHDGIADGITTTTNTWAFDATSNLNFNASNDSFWQQTNGSYADIRVYTRILSAIDIKQLYFYPNPLPSGIKINNAKINNAKLGI